MKRTSFHLLIAFTGLLMFSLSSCKKDHNNTDNSLLPAITVSGTGTIQDFGTVLVGQSSATKNYQVKGANTTADISITTTAEYQISLDNNSFSSSLTIPAAQSTASKTLYIKFTPLSLGVKTGTVTFETTGANTVSLSLTGTGGMQQTYSTFASERLAFGTGLSQSAEHQFTLPSDMSNVNKINMYVKLRCPTGGCGAWDVYAHVQIKDPSSGDWYELGRYITPYGVDNHASGRGFEIDVTDFKSLLQGTVTLRAFIEVWTADGWLLSVDFDYLQGAPDYPYYAISKVLQYNQNSLEGVIYGEDASAFDLTKTINIPANAENTHLRTIITGWGEATPYDVGGRPCAEWCFRTHHILINGISTFSHTLDQIGCATNPVQPQSGNWNQERAGWCPGMAVPLRQDQFATSMAGQSFNFEYNFTPWVNDLMSPNSNPHAYYAISTYVVVKSNTPIVKPTVID